MTIFKPDFGQKHSFFDCEYRLFIFATCFSCAM